jgi:hypothetical protein
MSVSARSKGACWTCRLRRKKCDEERPECAACASLSVPCYGYRKPSWADGGAQEREKIHELRLAIKAASSEKRRRTIRQQAYRKSNKVQSERISETASPEDIVPADVERQAIDYSADLTTLPQRQISIPPIELQDSEANLLMHYMDHVFPLQFPLYRPSPSEGGRGWLLSILLRTKPLLHAAVSLAAYHQVSLQCDGDKECCKHYVLEILERRHTLALKELRRYLDGLQGGDPASSPEGREEVLACIVLLISLEVCPILISHVVPKFRITTC